MSLCSPLGSIRSIPYSAFADRIESRVPAERIPLEGSLELTFRCNLRCVHCYVNEPGGDVRAKRQELSLAEIRRITDEAVDLGCLCLLLTGGEPLLRPDFSDIYLHLKRKGLLVGLFTNGTLVTPSIADLLAEWPPAELEVSIYGSTPAVHERITGIPGSYRQCLRGIELLLERKLRLRLKTVPTTLNYAELDGMRRLAAAYGVGFRWDPLVNCRVDGGRGPEAFRLPAGQIAALDQQDPRRAAESRKEFTEATPVGSGSDLFNCNAYRHSFHLDPYGNLLPCMMVRWPAYSLRESSFRQGWREAFPAMRNRVRTRARPCDTCRFASACGDCVGWAQVETGDPQGMVPFLCAVTQARAEVFAPGSPGIGPSLSIERLVTDECEATLSEAGD